MKKIIAALISLLLSTQPALAALSTGTQFQLQQSATANMVNGAGFNPGNANFLTNGVVLLGTTTAPTIASVSYSFVSGDIGAYVYLPAQSNIYPGWYKITGVTLGTATLAATSGASVSSINAQGVVTYTANNGIATTSGPTGVTFGVDYTQQNTAPVAAVTTGTQTAASLTFTDSTASPFTPAMAGDLMHITACTGTGCLVGWYEIVSVSSTSAVVLDRTATNGSNNITAATYYVGGAGNFGALEATFFAAIPSSGVVWMQYGASPYALSASAGTADANCTTTTLCYLVGFNTIRGDTPTIANRPSISTVTFQFIPGGTDAGLFPLENVIIQGRITNNPLTENSLINSKVSSTAVSQTTGVDVLASNGFIINSEVFSLNGPSISSGNGITIFGSYVHDGTICLDMTSTAGVTAIGNIFEGCTTGSVLFDNPSNLIVNNIFYGNANNLGYGISGQSNKQNTISNNIFSGLANGITFAASASTNISNSNDFYNNTTDVTNFLKNSNDVAINPAFASETTLTNQGTVTSSTTTLTDTGAAFGVTNGVDIIHITAITGSGCVTGGNLITNHTSTTLTLTNSPGASCTAISYWIEHGHNFSVGTALSTIGFPNFSTNTPGTTGYPAIGSVQPQCPAGAAGQAGYAFP